MAVLAIGSSRDAAPKQGTLSVSRGKVFQRTYRVPYVLPSGCEASIEITDAAGVTLAVFEGEVGQKEITFTELPAITDALPHGVNYFMSITYPDIGEPSPIEWGTVVRKEPRFTLLPPQDSTNYALLFEDEFDRELVGPRWRKIGGTTKLHTLFISGDEPAFGTDNLFFDRASVLWYAPLSGDSCTVNVNMVNPGAGKSHVVICSDYQMTSWLGLQFETGIIDNKWHIGIGHSPQGDDFEVMASADVTTPDFTNAVIKYNHLTKTVQAFKNGSSTVSVEWADDDDECPHGAGFRYAGFSFRGSLLSPGVLFTHWEIKDGI